MEKIITDLVLLARSGDADAFGKLYEIYSKEMFVYACSITGDSFAAEDAVGEAVVSAFKQIRNLREPASFKGWLFRIVHAESCKQYNARIGHITLDESVGHSGSTDAGGIDSLEMSLDLKRALSVLSSEEREIVLLKTVNEYTSKEIAEITGIPHATVRSKLSRARTKLRAEMEKNRKGG